MALKKSTIAGIVVGTLILGSLVCSYLMWSISYSQVEKSACESTRLVSYFWEPNEIGLLSVMGVELVQDEENPWDLGYASFKIVRHEDQVDKDALDKIISFYNADPSNTEPLSTDEVLKGLEGGFVDELLACDTSYSPRSQPYLLIDWCLSRADVVYAEDHTGLDGEIYDAGDTAATQFIYTTPIWKNNFAYIMSDSNAEEYGAETAFRWEYEANQGESV